MRNIYIEMSRIHFHLNIKLNGISTTHSSS